MVRACLLFCFLLLSQMLLPNQMARANDLAAPFFAQKPTVVLRLAPNGENYLVATVSRSTRELAIHDSLTQMVKNKVDLADVFDADTLFRDIKWLDNQYVAAVLIDKAEVETSLIERNIQTRLIVIDMLAATNKPTIYEVTTPGQLIEAAPSQAGVFYFARNARKSKVYKIHINKLLKINQKRDKLTRVDGGQFIAKNVVAQVDGFAIRWFFKSTGLPSAVVFFPEDGKMELALFETNEQSGELTPKEIKKWEEDVLKDKELSNNIDNIDKDKPLVFLPIAKAAETNSFYAIDYHEEERLNLYLVDYEAGTHETIFSSPGLPIQDILFSKNKQAIGVVVVEEGLYVEQYFDGQPTKNDAEKLEVVVDESIENDVKLLFTQTHNRPGEHLIKHANKSPIVVARQFLQLPEQLPSRQVKGSVVVDNMDIPYLLTLPEKASVDSPAPLIIMPHGGPFNVFDTPYFDPVTQFFAANGIAVLRVNYRGSGGYGLLHRDSGKKQWGKSILLELNKALNTVHKRKDIDATRTCAVGMSYGGYASLMLSIQSPDLFKCAVSVAGVTDMNLFLHQAYISEAQLKWLQEYVGDRVNDYEELMSISPLYQLHNFSTPSLLIHGLKDERVSPEHSFRAKLLLEQANADFTWAVYKDADHHFAEDDQSMRLFSQILDFVNQHLCTTEGMPSC